MWNKPLTIINPHDESNQTSLTMYEPTDHTEPLSTLCTYIIKTNSPQTCHLDINAHTACFEIHYLPGSFPCCTFLIITSSMEGEGGDVFTPFYLFVCRISQKVVERSGWNLVDGLGVWQGRTDEILVKIRIRIWIRELFDFLSDSSPLRDGAKPI